MRVSLNYLIHYLDDYLTMGPPESTRCQQNLDIFLSLCAELGIPLAAEKLEGPTTSLSFLGIILDTNRMEMRLPTDKVTRINQLLTTWLPKEKAITRWHSPPCNKGDSSGKGLCSQNVFYSSQVA